MIKAMRLTRQWFKSARTLIVDSGVASAHIARGFAQNGMCMIWNVTSGQSKFPRQWLISKAKARGQRGNHGWELLAALDCDKQPMCLLGTAGTTAMDETLTRNYSGHLHDTKYTTDSDVSIGHWT
jgi:hypothetical protein